MNMHDHNAFSAIAAQLETLPLTPAERLIIMADIRSRVAASPCQSERGTIAADVALARRIHSSRSRGNEIFGARVFSDPRFEMLLDLFVSQHDGRRVSVGDLSLAASVPQTTGLRQIDKLEANGFVRRAPDGKDGRRCWVEPTERAMNGVKVLLHDLRRQANGG